MRLTGKKKPVMEVRAFATEVRASPVEDGSGALRFEGYAALFNSWSQDLGGFRELIAPGAFTKALTADDVRMLMIRDPNDVLGRNRSGTLMLSEDDRGLRFEVTAPKPQWARDLHESVKRGDIDQCSFGFRTVRDDWRKSVRLSRERRSFPSHRKTAGFFGAQRPGHSPRPLRWMIVIRWSRTSG
jgi:HK97 family phage prohead protease